MQNYNINITGYIHKKLILLFPWTFYLLKIKLQHYTLSYGCKLMVKAIKKKKPSSSQEVYYQTKSTFTLQGQRGVLIREMYSQNDVRHCHESQFKVSSNITHLSMHFCRRFQITRCETLFVHLLLLPIKIPFTTKYLSTSCNVKVSMLYITTGQIYVENPTK